MDEQDYEDLISCLSEEEKAKILGTNFITKLWARHKMKKQAKQSMIYDAMIDNIEHGTIDHMIPDEYKEPYNEKNSK